MNAAHAADLDLAARCAAGDPAAWDRFVLEYRPVLYRAADALDPHGGARELADALYAELYGINGDNGERQSLFRYFQGRSSLATWLRAVLAQRYVDRLRRERRLEPLPDEERDARIVIGAGAARAAAPGPDPDRPRYLALIRGALKVILAALPPRDRLRLACYYVQELTLAQTGRLLHEHEATVSRGLARTRRAVRDGVERQLRHGAGLNEAQLAACFASVAADPGPLDLHPLFTAAEPEKGTPERVL